MARFIVDVQHGLVPVPPEHRSHIACTPQGENAPAITPILGTFQSSRSDAAQWARSIEQVTFEREWIPMKPADKPVITSPAALRRRRRVLGEITAAAEPEAHDDESTDVWRPMQKLANAQPIRAKRNAKVKVVEPIDMESVDVESVDMEPVGMDVWRPMQKLANAQPIRARRSAKVRVESVDMEPIDMEPVGNGPITRTHSSEENCLSNQDDSAKFKRTTNVTKDSFGKVHLRMKQRGTTVKRVVEQALSMCAFSFSEEKLQTISRLIEEYEQDVVKNPRYDWCASELKAPRLSDECQPDEDLMQKYADDTAFGAHCARGAQLCVGEEDAQERTQWTHDQMQHQKQLCAECRSIAQRGANKLANLLTHLRDALSAYQSDIVKLSEEAERIKREHSEHRAMFDEIQRRINACKKRLKLFEYAKNDADREERQRVQDAKKDVDAVVASRGMMEKQLAEAQFREKEMRSRAYKALEADLPSSYRLFAAQRSKRAREQLRFNVVASQKEIVALEPIQQAKAIELEKKASFRRVQELWLHVLHMRCFERELKLRVGELDAMLATVPVLGPVLSLTEIGVLSYLRSEMEVQNCWCVERIPPGSAFDPETLLVLSTPPLSTPMVFWSRLRTFHSSWRYRQQVVYLMRTARARVRERLAMKVVAQFKVLSRRNPKLRGILEESTPVVFETVSLVARCGETLDKVMRMEGVDTTCFDELGANRSHADSKAVAEAMEQLKQAPNLVDRITSFLDGWADRRAKYEALNMVELARAVEVIERLTDDARGAAALGTVAAHWFVSCAAIVGAFGDFVVDTGELGWLPCLLQDLDRRCGLLRAATQLLHEEVSKYVEEEHHALDNMLKRSEAVREEQRSYLARKCEIIRSGLEGEKRFNTEDLQHVAENWHLRLQHALRRRIDFLTALYQSLRWYVGKEALMKQSAFFSSTEALTPAVHRGIEAVKCIAIAPQLLNTGTMQRLMASELGALMQSTLTRVLKDSDPEAWHASVLALGTLDFVNSPKIVQPQWLAAVETRIAEEVADFQTSPFDEGDIPQSGDQQCPRPVGLGGGVLETTEFLIAEAEKGEIAASIAGQDLQKGSIGTANATNGHDGRPGDMGIHAIDARNGLEGEIKIAGVIEGHERQGSEMTNAGAIETLDEPTSALRIPAATDGQDGQRGEIGTAQDGPEGEKRITTAMEGQDVQVSEMGIGAATAGRDGRGSAVGLAVAMEGEDGQGSEMGIGAATADRDGRGSVVGLAAATEGEDGQGSEIGIGATTAGRDGRGSVVGIANATAGADGRGSVVGLAAATDGEDGQGSEMGIAAAMDVEDWRGSVVSISTSIEESPPSVVQENNRSGIPSSGLNGNLRHVDEVEGRRELVVEGSQCGSTGRKHAAVRRREAFGGLQATNVGDMAELRERADMIVRLARSYSPSAALQHLAQGGNQSPSESRGTRTGGVQGQPHEILPELSLRSTPSCGHRGEPVSNGALHAVAVEEQQQVGGSSSAGCANPSRSSSRSRELSNTPQEVDSKLPHQGVRMTLVIDTENGPNTFPAKRSRSGARGNLRTGRVFKDGERFPRVENMREQSPGATSLKRATHDEKIQRKSSVENRIAEFVSVEQFVLRRTSFAAPKTDDEDLPDLPSTKAPSLCKFMTPTRAQPPAKDPSPAPLQRKAMLPTKDLLFIVQGVEVVPQNNVSPMRYVLQDLGPSEKKNPHNEAEKKGSQNEVLTSASWRAGDVVEWAKNACHPIQGLALLSSLDAEAFGQPQAQAGAHNETLTRLLPIVPEQSAKLRLAVIPSSMASLSPSASPTPHAIESPVGCYEALGAPMFERWALQPQRLPRVQEHTHIVQSSQEGLFLAHDGAIPQAKRARVQAALEDESPGFEMDLALEELRLERERAIPWVAQKSSQHDLKCCSGRHGPAASNSSASWNAEGSDSKDVAIDAEVLLQKSNAGVAALPGIRACVAGVGVEATSPPLDAFRDAETFVVFQSGKVCGSPGLRALNMGGRLASTWSGAAGSILGSRPGPNAVPSAALPQALQTATPAVGTALDASRSGALGALDGSRGGAAPCAPRASPGPGPKLAAIPSQVARAGGDGEYVHRAKNPRFDASAPKLGPKPTTTVAAWRRRQPLYGASRAS